ncbi:MAG: DNA alkylation repair protein [Acidobacteria bacterium]|nr:DNA alkylation repair protein [Acidobacteriota bacterium]
MSELGTMQAELRTAADPARARFLARFFKTGPGEYAEGDLFLGITVPAVRKISRKHRQAPEQDVVQLLASPYHEERLLALLILVEQYRRGDPSRKQAIFELYLSCISRVNNWDLVDITAQHIIGSHLYGKDTSILTRLARSENLWERRIAMLSTYYFIRRGEADEALRIAGMLVNDSHDLIHKAVGWMLREVGKRCSVGIECRFLDRHVASMPRTMLRYAIELFPENLKAHYLSRKEAAGAGVLSRRRSAGRSSEAPQRHR